jgi:putative phosphoesterase
MKIAVLADIHGNYIAFEAVLKDAKANGAAGIIITGDHFNDVPQPMQVFNRLRSINAWIIKGNKEQRIIDYCRGKHPEWDSHLQMASFIWTYKQLNREALDYIDSLPEQTVIDLPGTDSIRVVHGSPFRIDELLYRNRNEDRITRSLQSIDEKVLVFGHTHAQWHKKYGDKLIINPGSVGVSFNEKALAEYSLIEWDFDHWKVCQRLVEYDKDELEREFHRSGYLNEGGAYAKAALYSIKAGTNEIMDFVIFAYKLAEERGIKETLIPNDIWIEAEKVWEWK